MRALFVTSECHPLIKTGGLADVSAALPAALAGHGIDIRVMMPGYPEALDRADHVGAAIPLGQLPGEDHARLLPARSPDSGMPLWLVDCPTLYRRNGGPYQGPDGRDWPDNGLRFAALGLLVTWGAVVYFGVGHLIGAFRLSDLRRAMRRG